MGALMKEQAGWVAGAPDLRPFDVPAQPDSSSPWMSIDQFIVSTSSRHGYLNPGEIYFKKAMAAVRYIDKKQSRYSRILSRHSFRYPVTYTPLSFLRTPAASRRRCTLCFWVWLKLLRHRRLASLFRGGHGQQWTFELTSSRLPYFSHLR